MKKFLLLLLFLSAGLCAYAQQEHHEMAPGGEGCKDMMATHEKMMGDMKDMDAKLDQLVAAMNSASGDKKMEAMGALLNEMVAQRKKMQGMMMMAMHPMGHAMMSGCCQHAEGKDMPCCSGDKKDMPCMSGDKKDKQ